MTVEVNAQFISGLNQSYPTNRDLIKEGDDHIRLVKAVLQNTFPGMDKAITPDADKINKLDGTFTYDSDTLNINNNIELASGKTASFGGATLKNVGDPKDPTDAINLQSLQGSLMWPVGSIFFTVDSRNPNEILGFGTWEKFAAGRVIIGTGTTTDVNNEAGSFINEAKGGSFSTTLTSDNLPAHKHTLKDLETAEDGSHKHDVDLRVHDYAIVSSNSWTGPSGQIAGEDKRFTTTFCARTKDGGTHSHKLSGDTDEVGKGEKFSNVQPYIACNIWKRLPDTTS